MLIKIQFERNESVALKSLLAVFGGKPIENKPLVAKQGFEKSLAVDNNGIRAMIKLPEVFVSDIFNIAIKHAGEFLAIKAGLEGLAKLYVGLGIKIGKELHGLKNKYQIENF